MALTTYENPKGQITGTEQSAANTALTASIPAGGAGKSSRIHKVVVSADGAGATSTLTIKPDNSTSSWVTEIAAVTAAGKMAEHDFDPPIISKDNTAQAIVVGALGGAVKSRITVVFDYSDKNDAF